MKQSFFYSLKVWLPTIIIAQLLYIGINVLFVEFTVESKGPEGVSTGFIFHLDLGNRLKLTLVLLLIIFWLATYFVNKTGLSLMYKKLILNVLALLLCFVFYMVHDIHEILISSLLMSKWLLLVFYVVLATLSIWIYRLKPIATTSPSPQQNWPNPG